MKILFVASECTPIAKVGGLGDVIGSLPKALKKIGVDVSVLIPFYGIVKLKKEKMKLALKEAEIQFGGKTEKFNLWQTSLPESDVPLFLIENKNYFKGNVYIETDASSGGSEEEAKRFLFLSLAATKIAEFLNTDILNCHDWHTALIPFLIKKQGGNLKTLLTIHNLGYQGIYSKKIVNQSLGINFADDVNCLREGIINADFINTVSPNYAKEILTPEYGEGLERELQKRKVNLIGILNGLDEEQFNPKSDHYSKKNYSVDSLDDKSENKTYLQAEYFKKIAPEIPILGIVSRLTDQKGINLIIELFAELMQKNIQFILLGQGKVPYGDFFKNALRKFPGKFFTKIGFDEKLAHQIYAGSDIFLMPSLFEPCGLGQLISMRYGTIPIARATGGLKDTVKTNSGFLFEKYNAQEFLKAIERALEVYKNKVEWRRMQESGMKQDFSWEKSAKEYLKIYNKLKV